MKKISTVLCLVIMMSAVAVQAQEYKKFRVGVGAGYAMPSGKGAKGGVLFYAEPGYRINDQIIANLRMEFAAMARGFSEDVGSAEFDVSTSGSYTLNGQYYFSNASFRPFVGVGFGMYSIKAAGFSSGGSSVVVGSDESKFGFYPRIGFDAGHFTLSLDYNLVGATKVEGLDGEFKNSYIGIRFGGFFGGGKN
jgi:outer membrane protein W